MFDMQPIMPHISRKLWTKPHSEKPRGKLHAIGGGVIPPELVVVADSVLGYLGNLCALDRSGVKFVVPLRADTGFAERFLKHVGHNALIVLR